jgi:ATP-dependent DNA helicase RecQ
MLGVLKALEKAATLPLEQLCAELNYPRAAMEKALKLLEVDGALEHDKAGYTRTANAWRPDPGRFEHVTQHRRSELAEMKRYVEHPGCLMEFLSRALDDPAAAPCGKCMNCTGRTERRTPPAALVQAAVDFLRSDVLTLEPRKWWPKPVLPELAGSMPWALERFKNGRPKMLIPEKLRPCEGRVLCIYGDAGWGQEVAHGKYRDLRFNESLVRAAADLICSKWNPNPPSQWVTAIPSQRHAALVQDFAQRLAERLGLPFVPVLRKNRGARPQKEMQNSAMQLRNVLRAFQVSPAPPLAARGSANTPNPFQQFMQRISQQVASVLGDGSKLPSGPVLLVDDVVDSGWTLTIAAVLLQREGCGPVYPFALAKASPRGR